MLLSSQTLHSTQYLVYHFVCKSTITKNITFTDENMEIIIRVLVAFIFGFAEKNPFKWYTNQTSHAFFLGICEWLKREMQALRILNTSYAVLSFVLNGHKYLHE